MVFSFSSRMGASTVLQKSVNNDFVMLNRTFMSIKYSFNLKECWCISEKASYFCVAFIFPTYQLSRILRGMHLTWRRWPGISLLVKVKITQLCSASCDPVDCTVHGILQAVPFSWGSSQPKDGTRVLHIAGWFFTSWATRGVLSTNARTPSAWAGTVWCGCKNPPTGKS